MKWKKIDQKTGEPATRGCWSYMPHDYVSDDFRIINNSFHLRKMAWALTRNNKEISKFNTLKEAKAFAENMNK